jgi:HK97 family phage major capsid protein
MEENKMRKKILEKKLARLNAKKQSLNTRCQASSDVNEVRELTEQLEDINAEIEETQAEIDAIDAEEAERSAQAEMEAREVPAQAQLVNGNIIASFQAAPIEQNRDENPTASMEYRQAFMNYIQRGTPIPAEVRNGETISTAETGAAIPITVMNEVINTVRKRYGNLYSKVRKLSVPGGVEIPIGSLSASFKWVNESTVSPRQKVNKLGKISFGYHTAEIRLAQTFLSQILTLSAFEAELTRVIAIAYLQAMDNGIMNGSGDGSMLGILNDPRVTNTITMTATKMSNWTAWKKDFFAQIPLGYRAGEFVFAASTVDAYLETMADSNNNPIFRQATGLEVNDGDAMNPNGRFFGREVAMVEPDIIADFDAASAGDVIGLFWQPNEYAINENFGFTMRRYFDEETNEWVDKALVVVDGKVLNPTGFYKIVKG